MAKVKYDGVIEAVHYAADGQVEWVRAYLRRGPAFSDRIMLDRQTLIEDLKAGLDRLLEMSDAEREKMGRAGRDHVRTVYEIDTVVDNWADLYAELLDLKSAAPR